MDKLSYVRDLEGSEYILQATKSYDLSLNSNQTVTFQIIPTSLNNKFIKDITEMWSFIDKNGNVYKILYCKKQGKGNKLTVDIKAIPSFFDTMNNNRIYTKYDEHMTAMSAFTKIFKKVPFEFVLVGTFDSVEWEGFGSGQTLLKTFQRALERYKCEFRISGETVYLEERVGRDTNFMYRYLLNASNIVKEIDAEDYWTFARGYGDYGDGEGGEDWEEALLKRDYTSPLARVVGRRDAPPIKNGKITSIDTMDSSLKKLVDDSLKISITTDIHDLRKQGYELAQPELGDRVFIIDERIGLNEEVRIINTKPVENWRGEIVSMSVTIGSDGLSKRHKSDLKSATDSINDLIEGRSELPYSVLPAAKRGAINALQSAQTELIFGTASNGVQGIIAMEEDDPNRIVWLNSKGWMISTDGGVTTTVAATADGIVADVITAGVINTDQVVVRGGNGSDYIYMNGSMLESNSGKRRIVIEDGNVYSYSDGDLAVRFGQYKLDFYHRDGSAIGSFGPTSIIDKPELQGLALDVQSDFISIGHWVGDRRRPVFRTQRFESNTTYVMGPYVVGEQAEILIGANSRIGLPKTADDLGFRTNQPTLWLRNQTQGETSNDAILYFGGHAKYLGTMFEIRRNTGKETSEQVAVFNDEYIRMNKPKLYFSDSSAHVENTSDALHIWSSDSMNGLKLWKGGQVDIVNGGSAIHKFFSNGNKLGGSILIDKERYGMFPTDSPQSQIEYVEFDIEVDGITEIQLDSLYLKAVDNFSGWLNNKDITIVEKTEDSIILDGVGATDVLIKGIRKEMDHVMWGNMKNNPERETVDVQ